jgi:hypothetical protein
MIYDTSFGVSLSNTGNRRDAKDFGAHAHKLYRYSSTPAWRCEERVSGRLANENCTGLAQIVGQL